jgi:hypothetical protein
VTKQLKTIPHLKLLEFYLIKMKKVYFPITFNYSLFVFLMSAFGVRIPYAFPGFKSKSFDVLIEQFVRSGYIQGVDTASFFIDKEDDDDEGYCIIGDILERELGFDLFVNDNFFYIGFTTPRHFNESRVKPKIYTKLSSIHSSLCRNKVDAEIGLFTLNFRFSQ